MINKTYVKCAHEETYSDGKCIGVVVNYSDFTGEKINSFVYLFNSENKSYLIFESIMEMNDYMLYGDKKVKKAIISESEFDTLHDSPFEGEFESRIKWNK